MKKTIKYVVLFFIVIQCAGLMSGQTNAVIDVRLYQGFKDQPLRFDSVEVTYRAASELGDGNASPVSLDKEQNALIKVYNLKALRLLTRSNLILKAGEPAGQYHEVAINGRNIRIQLTPLKKADTFNLEIKETDGDKHADLKTEILMPREKNGSLGFEGTEGRVYFLAFNRLNIEADGSGGDQEMFVYIFEQPTLLRKVNPVYPPEAMDKWISGTVVLDTTVGADGLVKEVYVLQSAHPLLDDAALAAVKQWKYKPFELKGKMDSLMFTVTLQFNLTPKPQLHAGRLPDGRTPEAVHTVPLRYPENAMKAYVTGEVELEVVIDKEGNVIKATALRGNPMLTSAAIRAILQWKFKPYIVFGKPQSAIFKRKFRFKLDKKGTN